MEYYAILVFYAGIRLVLDCNNNCICYDVLMIYYIYIIVNHDCIYIRNIVNILC